MIKTEKILDEFSKITDSKWTTWVQSGEKEPNSQCSFCEYNYSGTEFCYDRSNEPTIIQNLEILFDPIADYFDVEIPLTNVRRISETKYEIYMNKKVWKSCSIIHSVWSLLQGDACVARDIYAHKMV